jgi:hypothetical protein
VRGDGCDEMDFWCSRLPAARIRGDFTGDFE